VRSNERPRWEPSPEEIARECELIRAEKCQADNDARIVGEKNAHMWNVPVVKHRNVPPMSNRSDYR
jgi:hypothetical protein